MGLYKSTQHIRRKVAPKMKLNLKKWSNGRLSREDAERQAAEEIERQVAVGKPSAEEWVELEERLAHFDGSFASPNVEETETPDEAASAGSTVIGEPEPEPEPAPDVDASSVEAPKVVAPTARPKAKATTPRQAKPAATKAKAKAKSAAVRPSVARTRKPSTASAAVKAKG